MTCPHCGAAMEFSPCCGRVEGLKAEVEQLSKWADGLVDETQRLQHVEFKLEQAEARLAISQKWSAGWKKLTRWRGWPSSEHERNRQGRVRAEARLAKVVEHWTDTEARSAEAHAVYQQEAHRRGDVRHPDSYSDLTEATKEWDRVLVRWVHATCAAIVAQTDHFPGPENMVAKHGTQEKWEKL